jgi:hypothetical protein
VVDRLAREVMDAAAAPGSGAPAGAAGGPDTLSFHTHERGDETMQATIAQREPATRTAPVGTNATVAASKKELWAGRVIGALPVLFLLFDGIGKLVKPAPVVEGTLQLGYQASVLVPLGIVLLACTILYAVPRTAVLGAILLTGYLGGAVATHVRVDNPLLTHTLFPIYFGVMLWGSLYLRDPRVRALLPLRS